MEENLTISIKIVHAHALREKSAYAFGPNSPKGMCLQTFSKVNFKDGRCSTAATSHGLERANVHQEGPD